MTEELVRSGVQAIDCGSAPLLPAKLEPTRLLRLLHRGSFGRLGARVDHLGRTSFHVLLLRGLGGGGSGLLASYCRGVLMLGRRFFVSGIDGRRLSGRRGYVIRR